MNNNISNAMNEQDKKALDVARAMLKELKARGKDPADLIDPKTNKASREGQALLDQIAQKVKKDMNQ